MGRYVFGEDYMNRTCPVCRSQSSEMIGTRSDRAAPTEICHDFAIARCAGECGALYTCYPADWDVHAIYQGANYHVTRQALVGHPPYEERYAHDLKIAKDRLCRVETYRKSSGGRLIDIGCSNGALVACAWQSGYDAYGCDISPYIIEKTREILANLSIAGERLFVMNVDEHIGLPIEPFDVIQCNDVIEHSIDPIRFLDALHKMLAPGGFMFIDTPDFDDPEFVEEGLAWRHIRPVEHTVYLHERSLKYMAEAVGLKIVDFYRPIRGKIVLIAE